MKSKLLLLIVASCLFTSSVFSQCSVIHNFDGSTSEGADPTGSLISINGKLYGMTTACSNGCNGMVFKINPDGTGFTRILEFGFDSDGGGGRGSLTYDGTYLYGMTSVGGNNNRGIIFKVKPDATGYAKLFDFGVAATGSNPTGDLLIDGNFLYGMTPEEGVNGYGTIFKIMKDGTGFLKLRDFAISPDGSHPNGSMIKEGNYLYGPIGIGGISHGGTIFKMMEDGTGFAIVHNFPDSTNATDGRSPIGSLVSDGTWFYGMTYGGGTGDLGTIYKIMPDGTGFETIFRFNGTNGKNPYGSLIVNGTLLYGMTNKGGTSGTGGTLFSIEKDGTGFIEMCDFFNLNAYYPQGTPLSDGNFLYGMIEQGGSHTFGAIYKTALATGIAEEKETIEYTISPNPFANQLAFTLTDNEPTTVTLYNFLGQQVMQQTITGSTTLNTTQMQTGIYFYELKNAKGIIRNGKVVKE